LKRWTLTAILGSALLCCATTAWAQAQMSSADLTGTVRDPAKALLVGATVTATNLATNVTRSTTANTAGAYRIPLLVPGEYEVKAEKSGFAPQVKRGITRTVGQTAVLDFDLQLGQVTTQIEIASSETPLIEPERTHQADTVTARPIQNLPINGRNFLGFALLTPGVVEENPAFTSGLLPQIATSNLSFAGQSGRANSITVDGADNNDIATNGVRPTISQEAVQEFQINRSSYNAEFGRASGGLINIVSRSGTNRFHGNLYDYFRHERLDARNAFATSYAQAPPFKRNQPGFTFGGPLVKEQTFFFTAYEGLFRRESAFTTILSDPTILQPTPGQQELLKTFASVPLLAPVAEQLTPVLTTAPNSVFPSATMPIPHNRLTYQLLASAVGAFPVRDTQSVASARFDHIISQNAQLLLRYNLTNDSQHGTGVGGLNAPSAGFDIALHDHAIVFGENHIFNAQTFNEFRFQFARNVFNVDTVDPFGPRLSIAGIGEFGRDFNAPADRLQHRLQFVENFSYERGRHHFKLGVDFNRYTIDGVVAIFRGGQIDYARLPIPLSALIGEGISSVFARLLNLPKDQGGLGRPDLVPVLSEPLTTIQQFNLGFALSVNQGFGDARTQLTGYLTGLYWQDSLRVKQSFHLNYGVRYDVDKQSSGLIRDYNNVAPRFGFTWLPFKGTVVRGGAGLYYQSLYTAASFIAGVLGKRQQITNLLVTPEPRFTPISPNSECGRNFRDVPPSFCFVQQLIARGSLTLPSTRPLTEELWTSLLGLTRATSSNRITLDFADDAVNPYSFQGSFGVDQFLSRDWIVSLNYLTNHGLHIIRSRQVNALPNPQLLDPFGRPTLTNRADAKVLAKFLFETAGSSIYHGMTAALTKRFSGHYQLLAAYTLGKVIDDATDLNTDLGPQDPLNARQERSLSVFDVRHRLSLSAVVESPYKTPLLANFIIAPLLTVRSAFPFNITTGIDINQDGNNNDRPFAVGRNTGRGPRYVNLDLRLARRFPFSKDNHRAVEVILDSFNLFNRVNFKEVNGNTGGALYLKDVGLAEVRVKGRADLPSSSFGGFISAFDPRIVQVALKLSF
jgi:hypothetical protein